MTLSAFSPPHASTGPSASLATNVSASSTVVFPSGFAKEAKLNQASSPKKPKTYHIHPKNTLLVRTYDQVLANGTSSEPSFTVLDARSPGRFAGSDPEPRPTLPSGHMPNSINVPFQEVLNPETGEMLPPEKLREVFSRRGVDLGEGEIVASCGSGITASVLFLALERAAGGERRRMGVYDGSWTEYAGREGSPILKK